MLTEALEHLVRGLVSDPERVRVREFNSRRGHSLEVRVGPNDIGKVIGRQGRTAKALRTVVEALAGARVRVDFADSDSRARRR